MCFLRFHILWLFIVICFIYYIEYKLHTFFYSFLRVYNVYLSMTASVWSTILFIVWPQEELQLACAGETMVGAAAFIVNTEGFCVWGENRRLWCKAPRASSLHPLPLSLSFFLLLSLLRLEFISLPPFSSQWGKTSLGNSLDYPIIFLLQHGWGEWEYTTEIFSRFLRDSL